MKIQPYIDKLNSSEAFNKFREKNPDAFFSAGFFVLDFHDKNNLHQLDYYLPKTKKMVTFSLDGDVEMKIVEAANSQIPKKIDGAISLDLDTIKGIVEDEMKNRVVTSKLQKIIAILQNIDGKLVWNLNCITTDMGILKIHLDDETHSILKFEKVNLFDVVKKLKD